MKELFRSMTIIALLFAGCSGNQTRETDNTEGAHTHEDGSVHQDHEDGIEPDQEEFMVPSDTTSEMEEAEHDHQADEEHEHSHDGHDHHHDH